LKTSKRALPRATSEPTGRIVSVKVIFVVGLIVRPDGIDEARTPWR